MYTVHRIYIGARNTPHHKFLPNDEIEVNKTLKKYLRGWTITKSNGYWGHESEETLILTVVESPQNRTGYGNGSVSAVGAIASFLHQYAIMWESNGTAVIVPTLKNPAPPTPPAAVVPPPAPKTPKKRKPKP